MAEGLKTITLAELRQHKDKSSGLWIAVHNRVFDVTKFVTEVGVF
jgi:cytochrome b involved in lipid metabolism